MGLEGVKAVAINGDRSSKDVMRSMIVEVEVVVDVLWCKSLLLNFVITRVGTGGVNHRWGSFSMRRRRSIVDCTHSQYCHHV